MARIRPTSILQLTLIGFTVVTVPLIGALLWALFSVDGLAEKSQRAAFDAARLVQSSRTLVEEITDMERHARQYHVLGDNTLRDLYLKGHEQFQENVTGIGDIVMEPTQKHLLGRVATRERRIFDILSRKDAQKDGIEKALDEFAGLANLARSLLSESIQLIVRQANEMQRQADAVQRLLIWQSVILISTALLLAALFAVLITRPLRQIDRAIRRLGAGEFSDMIEIRGPRDLEELGRRLEWLRNRLVELETQKISVLRHISHEFKTPLTVIREGTELLNEGVVGSLSQGQAEIAGILRDNSLKLQKRIEDLLSFSVARTPVPVAGLRTVDLHTLVEGVVDDHKLAIKAGRLSVKSELRPVTTSGDPDQLRVIMDNLFSNAIKYSPGGGTIRITLQQHGGNAVLEVRDEGPGIHQEEKTRIFEAFYQGRARHEGQVEGTGLGLAIAQEFARLHEGLIELVDDPARGARMRLTLPMKAA
jgi:two-component system sensor histidine kinase GlrK